MATETGRHRLYEKIKEQWGEDHAVELMSYLPPVGWADVATKQDLDALRVATKQDVDALRVATEQDLRLLAAELRAEMAELGSKVDLMGAALRTEMKDESRSQLRWLLGILLPAQGVTIGLFAVVVNWLH